MGGSFAREKLGVEPSLVSMDTFHEHWRSAAETGDYNLAFPRFAKFIKLLAADAKVEYDMAKLRTLFQYSRSHNWAEWRMVGDGVRVPRKTKNFRSAKDAAFFEAVDELASSERVASSQFSSQKTAARWVQFYPEQRAEYNALVILLYGFAPAWNLSPWGSRERRWDIFRPLRMSVNNWENSVIPVKLTATKLTAQISGLLARVTVLMTFTNDSNHILEGNLQFPLPEGATVSSYALDVDGEMVQASLVEKKTATQAIEREKRKKIRVRDPGLVEVVQGNLFNTRVYPINAGTTRYVEVTYITQLIADSHNSCRLEHPFTIENPVNFSFEISVLHDVGMEPRFENKALSSFAFTGNENPNSTAVFSANGQVKDFKCEEGAISVQIPVDNTDSSCFVEKGADGQQYFAVQDALPPSASIEDLDHFVSVKRVSIIWDASFRRHSQARTRDIDLVTLLAQKLNEGTKGSAILSISLLRHTQENEVEFSCKDSDKLKEYLTNGVTYDGAKRFDALLPPSQPTDFVILFSDGIFALGKPRPEGLDKFPPIFAVSPVVQAVNHNVLQSLSSLTGGAYLPLNRIEDNARVVAALGRPSYSLVHVESVTPGALIDLHPQGAVPLHSKGKSITVTGKFAPNVKAASVTLHYGFDRNSIVESKTFDLVAYDGVSTGLIPLLWAQQELDQLLEDQQRNKDQILAVGRKFNIVTPGTSLIVLETLEQHLENRIEPHPSRESLLKQYKIRIEDTERDRDAKRRTKVTFTLPSMWQVRKSWWNRPTTYTAGTKIADLNDPWEKNGPVEPSTQTLWWGSPNPPRERKDAKREKPFSPPPPAGAPLPAPGAPMARDAPLAPGVPPAPLAQAPIRPQASSQSREAEEVAEGMFLSTRRSSIGTPTDDASDSDNDDAIFGGNEPINADFDSASESSEGEEEVQEQEERQKKSRKLSTQPKDGAPPPPPKASAPRALRKVSDSPQSSSSSSSKSADKEKSKKLGRYEVKSERSQGPSVNAKVEAEYKGDDEPYMASLKTASSPSETYAAYLKEREANQSNIFYFADCAKYLADKGSKDLGLRVLLTTIELKPDDARTLRLVAFYADWMGELATATELFEKVVEVRPMEPAGHYHLALALERKGEYQRAFDILWHVLSNPDWETELLIDQAALVSLNALISRSKAFTDSSPMVKLWKFKQTSSASPSGSGASSGSASASANPAPEVEKKPDPKPFKLNLPKELHQELITRVDVDLRVVLTWDTTATDCDLHVLEPSGQRVMWKAKNSKMGGFYPTDVKTGLGPEEYVIKSAFPGDYVILAKYHRHFPSVQTGPTTLRFDIYTNYARINQSVTTTLVRLKPGAWSVITRVNVPTPEKK